MSSSLSSIRTKKDDDGPFRSLKTTVRIFDLGIPERPKPDPKFYLDAAWEKLKPTIKAIFLNEPKKFHYSDIMNSVEDAWLADSGEALFQLIVKECETYISKDIQSLERECKDDPSVFLPSSVVECWLNFHSMLECLCSFAAGNNRIIGKKTLLELGKDLFPKHMMIASNLHEMVLSTILDMIKDQRLGMFVDTGLLNNLMRMFYGPCFYKRPRYFEERFIKCAIDFYSVEAKKVLECSDITKYLKHVEKRLCEEKEKCNSLYFFQLFGEPLIEAVERELLVSHASCILETGFAKLMDQSCYDDLHRLYVMFCEANLLDRLNDSLRSYISITGEKIKNEASLLSKFKASVDKIWLSYFLEDPLLRKTIKQCFQNLDLSVSEWELI